METEPKNWDSLSAEEKDEKIQAVIDLIKEHGLQDKVKVRLVDQIVFNL